MPKKDNIPKVFVVKSKNPTHTLDQVLDMIIDNTTDYLKDIDECTRKITA